MDSKLIKKKDRDKYIQEIIDFFETERDQTIGIIAAEEILDFFSETIGKQIYNKAVDDSKSLLKDRLEGLELDMDSILKI